MFSLFSNSRTGRKGQLASLMTVFLVIFIIFAFLSVNLGRIALQRTRTSNAADAAALAAGSSASRLLNYMAAFNDLMALNFSGMAFTLIPAFTVFIVDLVDVIADDTNDDIIDLFDWIFDQEISYAEYLMLLLYVEDKILILGIDIDTIGFLVSGAKKVGDVLSERMVSTDPDDPGMNTMLPESTRNTARQYAFINAGIDEPKEDYDDWLDGRPDTDANWKAYVTEESEFGAFMRTLPNRNDKDHPNYDSDFGADNLISFDWDDERAEKKVNNQVDVYTTPIQPLDLTVESFEDVATDSGLRDMLNNAVDNSDSSWAMSELFKMGITMSPLTYVLVEIIRVMIEIITVLIGILMVVAAIIGVVYTIMFAISCLPYGATCNWDYFWTAAKAYSYAAAAGTWYALMAVLDADDMDPSDVPALVLGDESNDLTVEVKVNRTTTPEEGPDSLDYGFWTMDYPQVRSGSKVLAEGSGGGLLFPPVTDYGPVIQKAW